MAAPPVERPAPSPASRRGCPSAPGVSADVDPVVTGDPGEPGRVALPDRAELPLAAAPVELAEHQRRLGGGVLAEVEPGDLAVVGLVHDPDVGVVDLAEALPPGIGVVDADREDDLVDVRRHPGQVDLDDL